MGPVSAGGRASRQQAPAHLQHAPGQQEREHHGLQREHDDQRDEPLHKLIEHQPDLLQLLARRVDGAGGPLLEAIEQARRRRLRRGRHVQRVQTGQPRGGRFGRELALLLRLLQEALEQPFASDQRDGHNQPREQCHHQQARKPGR